MEFKAVRFGVADRRFDVIIHKIPVAKTGKANLESLKLWNAIRDAILKG